MSQVIFSDINPATTSGTQLATLLNAFKAALMSGLSGTSRPSALLAGGGWVDLTNDPTYWQFKIYTGSVDIEVFRINLSTGKASFAGAADTFELSRISADAVGPIMKLIKNRIATNGQVLSGDIVGQLQFIGRADDNSNPVVANVKIVAGENETSTQNGSYLVIETTPTGQTTAVEHLRLQNGFLGVGGATAPDSVIHARGATGIKSEYDADNATSAKITIQKGRVTGTGAIQSGDAISEVVTNTKDSASAVVQSAGIKTLALENHTGSVRGTKMQFNTTTTGAATPTSKLEVGDSVEPIVVLKVNSMQLTSQNVATAATIAQLDGSKVLVEMTGSTATSVQGINSSQASKVVTIHNRSSAIVTLSHQDAGAAAADRFKLPGSLNFTVNPESSVVVFYCTTDSRWKLRASAEGTSNGRTLVNTVVTADQNFIPPGGVTRVRVLVENTIQFKQRGVNGFRSAGVINQDGQMWMWGQNTSGQLGNNSITTVSTPVLVAGGNKFVQAFSLGGFTEYALDAGGTMWAWGDNGNGNLGDGTIVSKSTPVQIGGQIRWKYFPKQGVQGVGVSTNFTMGAIDVDGNVWTWGQNGSGALGDGTIVAKSSPIQIAGTLKFTKLLVTTVGTNASMFGITTTGAMYSWGTNTSGLLGTGVSTPSSSPVQVAGAKTWTDVATSTNAVWAIDSNSDLWSWGSHSSGSTGQNLNTGSVSSPVQIGSPTKFTAVYGTESGVNIFALDTSGNLWTAGVNGAGQIGDGTIVSKSTPVQVVGGGIFKEAFVAGSTGSSTLGWAHAIDTSGNLWAWGANANGQLGDNTLASKSSPVQVSGSLKWSTVLQEPGNSAGTTTTVMGVTSDGIVWQWGQNLFGQLGNNSVTNSSSPVQSTNPKTYIIQSPQTVYEFDVTPLATYPVAISTGLYAKFNNVPLNPLANKITIQYYQ